MAYQYADPSAPAPGGQSPGSVAAPAYAAAPPGQYAPAPYGYGYGYPPYVDPNELRTLFFTGDSSSFTCLLACPQQLRMTDDIVAHFARVGFPPDVKERELNNLLRFLPGYEVDENESVKIDDSHPTHVWRQDSSQCPLWCLQASQLHLAGVKSPQVRTFDGPSQLCYGACASASAMHLALMLTSCLLCLSQAQGFALFDCGASAQGALHRVTNLV